MGDLDAAGRGLQALGRQMEQRAGAGRAVAQRAGPGTRRVEQALQRIGLCQTTDEGRRSTANVGDVRAC